MDDDVLSGLPDLSEPDLSFGEEAAVEEDLLSEVQQFFVSFLKTIRASQLYVEGNPLTHKFLDELKQKLKQLWDRTASLNLLIFESEIRWSESVVYSEKLGSPDNLAFQLYKDGIRRVELFPGVEEDEIRQLMEILRLGKALKEDEEDDLLTLLWNTNFSFVRYEYVDVLGDEPPIPEVNFEDLAGTELPTLPELELSPELQTPQLREDFEPSLYFLDEAEVAHLQQELQTEWDRQVKGDVMLALLDQFQTGNKDRLYEIMGILRQMLPRILAEGDFGQAADVVIELGRIADMKSDPVAGDQVDQIVGELSEPIVLEQLVKIMEDGLVEPGSEDLATLLNALKPSAIVVLMESIPLIVRPEARTQLLQTLDRLADMNPVAIRDLVQSKDPRVAAEAAKIAGRLKMVDAADAIASLLDRNEYEVREAAVEALVGLRTSRAGKPLLKALNDSSREVRLAAARGLAELRYNPGAAELETHVKNKEVWGRDLTEQLAIFEAYAAAAGDDGVKLLNRMLTGRRYLWVKYPGPIRACAARGLGIAGGDDAVRALAAGQKDRDPMVRSAVHAAQRGPEEASDEHA